MMKISLTINGSLLFAVYLGYSIWSLLPTAEERAEREAEYQDDLEMKKLSMYGMDDDLSRDERRERNRELFMNLPKTPTFSNQPMTPRTPRTMAFTQLNGGPAHSGYGNKSAMATATPLPFREHYGGNVDAR